MTIYPHERINRILKIIEEKQNGRCISCKQHITNKHVVVSNGRPRNYYHKDCAIKKPKKKYEKNQAISQANACGNGELPLNVFCQNIGSQVQGEENAVSGI